MQRHSTSCPTALLDTDWRRWASGPGLGCSASGRLGRWGRQLSREKAELAARATPLRCRTSPSRPIFADRPFAVCAYSVHADFGGDAALGSLAGKDCAPPRRPSACSISCPTTRLSTIPWVQSHPDTTIHGSENDLAREPHNLSARLKRAEAPAILAHGRDPYFPGWPDSFQLNYRHPDLRRAMIDELKSIADRCDGVRCDIGDVGCCRT